MLCAVGFNTIRSLCTQSYPQFMWIIEDRNYHRKWPYFVIWRQR